MLTTSVIHDLKGGGNTQTTSYSYDDWGHVIKVHRSSMLGSCQFTHTFYNYAGAVTATVCGTAELPSSYSLETLYDPNNPDKYRVTIYEFDTMGRRIKERTNVGSADAQAKYLYYDALNRPLRTVTNVYTITSAWSAVGQWIWDTTQKAWKTSTGGTIVSHGTYSDQNIVEDYQYNELGKIRLKREASGQVTLYGYTPKGNLKREIRNASNPNYFEQHPGDGNIAYRIDMSLYDEVSNPDLDIETEYNYDSTSRLIRAKRFRIWSDPTTDNFETITEYEYNKVGNLRREIINPTENTLERAKPDHYVVSARNTDEVGRPSRTRRLFDYYSWQPGSEAQFRTTLHGWGLLDHQVRTIASASDPDYVTNPATTGDHSLSNYPSGSLPPSADPDLDLITYIKYDVLGRKIFETDVLEQRTWFAYDGIGRIIRTVKNAVGTAEDGGINDPRSNSYVISSLPDQDLVTNTFYNTDGHVQRVQEIKDTANPNAYWAIYQYDSVGRVTREIRNANNAAYYASGAWSNLSGYGALSSDSDKDLATTTVYDSLGRVQIVRDERTNNVVYTSYDQLGRTVVTVKNYLAQGATNPLNWVWNTSLSRWENGSGAAINHDTKKDQNLISTTRYDVMGRVISTRATDGAETRMVLDNAGRVTQQIENYMNGVFSPALPDEDRITSNTYNKASYLLTTTDPRSTVTAYEYDRVGRKRKTTIAHGTALATAIYTCYNKVGDVLRVIQNYVAIPGQDPDKRTATTTWQFNPTTHGADNDQNLITEYRYDKIGRQIQAINPVGSTSFTTYNKGGLTLRTKDALNVETLFFYDRMKRLSKVIQAFLPQPYVPSPGERGNAPESWHWDVATNRREDGLGDIIGHNLVNDRNLIVQMTYDKAGRMLTRREPRGNLTTYTYDKRDRRRTLTNPLNVTWETQYSDLTNGRTQENQIQPGLNGSATPYTVQRQFDRVGRMDSVQFGDAASTPNITLDYTLAGQRALMTETGASSTIRKTEYTYDKAHRLTQTRFDMDGSSTYDQTVQYQYDAGGLRTQLKVVTDSDRTINYVYDAKGQQINMSFVAQMSHSIGIIKQVNMSYTKAGWLKLIERNMGTYPLNSRYSYNAAGQLLGIEHKFGSWNTLAQFNYTVNAIGNRTQVLEKWRPNATDPMVERTIHYAYDSVSRLHGSSYYPSLTVIGTPIYDFWYNYDLSGNRVAESLNGAPRYFAYNAANQLFAQSEYTADHQFISASSLTYDLNGNLLSDGTNSYGWDRANRLLSMGGASYAYDGDGDRVSRTVTGTLTRYLLDKQTPLTLVLSETTSSATKRYLHGPTGIFGQQDNTQTTGCGTNYLLQDGLGSVCAISDGTDILSAQAYSPYGETLQTALSCDFSFTGEQIDPLNHLVYLRARYLNPRLGVFGSKDPFAGESRNPLRSIDTAGFREMCPILLIRKG